MSLANNVANNVNYLLEEKTKKPTALCQLGLWASFVPTVPVLLVGDSVDQVDQLLQDSRADL